MIKWDYYPIKFKLIISGFHIESYSFSRSLRKPLGFRCTNIISPNPLVRYDNLNHSKQSLRRLINSNLQLDKFMSLTYANTMTDFNESNRLFSKFIMRLKYNIKTDLRYIAVPEFQKDIDYYGNKKKYGGSIHYHLLSNIPFTENKKIENLWGYGYTKTLQIKDYYDLGGYMTKYFTKDYANKRYYGKKKYFTSKNVDKPLVYYGLEAENNFEYFKTNDLEMKQQVKYENEYLGQITYTYYRYKNMQDFINLPFKENGQNGVLSFLRTK